MIRAVDFWNPLVVTDYIVSKESLYALIINYLLALHECLAEIKDQLNCHYTYI